MGCLKTCFVKAQQWHRLGWGSGKVRQQGWPWVTVAPPPGMGKTIQSTKSTDALSDHFCRVWATKKML